MSYNPSNFTTTNKPVGLTNNVLDARSYFYDTVNFVTRAYVDTAEVLAYLLGNNRVGQFSIIINTGGVLSNGVITGGTNAEWWFKDGILDGDLVAKGSGGGLSSTNFGTWTAMPSSSGQMINANFPLSYKLDLSAFAPKTIVYIQGQFGLDASFFGVSLLLGILPTGSRPAAQVKKYFIFQNIEMFLQIDTNGNVSLISKDAFNLPVTTGTPEIQPYYLDIFFLAS